MRERRPKIRRVTLHKDDICIDPAQEEPSEHHWRPKTRADCVDLPRPCPYVGCKFHLYLDFTPFGSMKFNFGEGVDVLDEMPETCVLDVADRSGQDMSKIGRCLNVTPARVQQEVTCAMIKLQATTLKQHNDPDGEVE